jgi:Rieske Fe-S protein
MKRRVFLERLVQWSAITGISVLTLFGIFPELLNKRKFRSKVILGKREQVFSQNNVITKRINNETIIIMQDQSGDIQAFNAKCTHAGCLVEWKEDSNSFLCKCHGGAFNKKGDPIAGPPKKPLKTHLIEKRVSSGDIILYLDDASA